MTRDTQALVFAIAGCGACAFGGYAAGRLDGLDARAAAENRAAHFAALARDGYRRGRADAWEDIKADHVAMRVVVKDGAIFVQNDSGHTLAIKAAVPEPVTVGGEAIHGLVGVLVAVAVPPSRYARRTANREWRWVRFKFDPPMEARAGERFDFLAEGEQIFFASLDRPMNRRALDVEGEIGR